MIPLYLSRPSLWMPTSRLSNADVLERVRSRYRGPAASWPAIEHGLKVIFQASGSRERYRELDPTARIGTTAVRAARECLARYELEPEALEVVLHGGCSREYIEPATAMEVSAKLGLEQVRAMDVTSACAGQVMAVYTACAWFHMDDNLQTALITTAEILGDDCLYDIQNPEEVAIRGAGVTMGEGASAWLLTRQPLSGGCLRILAVDSAALPQYWQLSQTPIGGRLLARSSEMLRVGNEAVPFILKVLDHLGWTLESIDQFVLHQPGEAMHQKFLDALGITPDQAINVHALYGNTASVGVSTAFHEYLERHRPVNGARIVLVATGAGLTGCLIAGEWVE